MMHRNRSVDAHQFAMVPKADIPRAGFKIESGYKSTFNAGDLIPVYCSEVLPGDTFNLRATMFARLATPIVPIMDNIYLDSFFFFVPARLLWVNFQRFMGERDDPTDTIDFTIPQINPSGAFNSQSIYDYFGIPCSGQVTGALSINALPLRAYNLIWNEWFRDENLQDSVPVLKGDGPDLFSDYNLLRRGKRHDYFTSCLPWTQKGAPVTLPLGLSAPISLNPATAGTTGIVKDATSFFGVQGSLSASSAPLGQFTSGSTPAVYDPNGTLFADLSQATAATINQIRQAFQIQKLLERDARGGTRYTEVIRSHFGVLSPDARLQRPEYLGGGTSYVTINPIAQTSGTPNDPATGYTSTPAGALSAVGTVLAQGHGFTQSFTEHGYVLGLISVRADLNYQQGLHKMWSRRTRYDFYWPVFSHLGEQAVHLRELYATGTSQDETVFGYQERWAEYRYKPSLVTSFLKSYDSGTLDIWHLAQNFATAPTLNETFIQENPPMDRIIATTDQTGQQFVIDIFFSNKAARPLPLYSVPGLVDHF